MNKRVKSQEASGAMGEEKRSSTFGDKVRDIEVIEKALTGT